MSSEVRQAEALESRTLLTGMLRTIALGGSVTILPEVNGKQILAVYNSGNTDLYTTDGTQAGTVLFGNVPGTLSLYNIPNIALSDNAVVGQHLFFNAFVAGGSYEHSIWRTDGTAAGTVKLLQQNVSGTPLPSGFTEFDGLVYFAANAGSTGRELWKSDGTPTGTTLAVDVIPGSTGSSPRQLRTFDGQLFFTATATETIYRTDGTEAGTVSVIDGDFQWAPISGDVGTVVVAETNSRLILKRETEASGIDLLAITSATAAPTVIQHFSPAANSTFVLDGFTVVGTNAFFRRGNTAGIRFSGEVWKTNGTTAGTAAVSSFKFFDAPINKFGLEFAAIDFVPGVHTDPAGDRLVFFANAQTTHGLWQTDGITLTDIPADTGYRPIGRESLLAHDGRLYSIVPSGGIFEVDSELSSGRFVGGFSSSVDRDPGQLTTMLGSVWFVAHSTLWKVDPALPDAVPGPGATANSFSASLGTTVVNGQNVFRVSWNTVPGAVEYRINGVPSGPATFIDIPYVNETDYTLRVQAILPSGQFSTVSDFSFKGFLNSNNLSFVGATAFSQNVILQRDIGTSWLYRAEFYDPLNGKVFLTSSFRWQTVGNVEQATLSCPADKIPVTGKVAVRVLPYMITSATNAATVSFDLRYSEISVSFSGAATTITWPSVAGPEGYDLWINDETRNIGQYIRNSSLATNSFAHTFPPGTYKIWVRPNNFSFSYWSQPEWITVGIAPKLLSPTGTFNTPDLTDRFRWPVVKGATGYELWVNQIGGTTKIIHETSLPANSTSFTPATQLPHGRYQAWIRSQGTGPGHGVWSVPVTFTILPRIVQPVVTTSQFDPTPTISWTAPFAGIKYELWIGKADGTEVFRVKDVTTTSFTLSTALASGSYKVSLRGVTADGLVIPWSNSDKAPLTIGLQGIVYVSLSGIRRLTWDPVSGATHYDIWVNYVSGAQPPQSQIYRNMAATGDNILLPNSLPTGGYRVWIRAIRVEAGITFMTEWTPGGRDFSLT